MQIEFIGAAQTVTGSTHLVRTKHATILLDCGLFQGRRRESIERNKHLDVDASKVDGVVLSYAHIDHSGALPLDVVARPDVAAVLDCTDQRRGQAIIQSFALERAHDRDSAMSAAQHEQAEDGEQCDALRGPTA